MRSNLTVDEIEAMVKDFGNQVLDLALRLREKEIEIENKELSRLLETYKSKSDLLIERVRPVDMHLIEGGLKK